MPIVFVRSQIFTRIRQLRANDADVRFFYRTVVIRFFCLRRRLSWTTFRAHAAHATTRKVRANAAGDL
jgi:hypothetical protein